MKILEFQHNTHLAIVYYNGGKSNLFRIHVDVTSIYTLRQVFQFQKKIKYYTLDTKNTSKLNRMTDPYEEELMC
jgi:hypothetical protein